MERAEQIRKIKSEVKSINEISRSMMMLLQNPHLTDDDTKQLVEACYRIKCHASLAEAYMSLADNNDEHYREDKL